jgi:thiol-disulfide isomerase/thioredoxin
LNLSATSSSTTQVARGLLSTDVQLERATTAPELPHQAPADWINSAPLTLASLRGSVVLVEFWTFDCYNCRNTFGGQDPGADRARSRRKALAQGVGIPQTQPTYADLSPAM